jgi:hypothetical protein
MADPISIIGAAGAIANIIAVLAKTVSTLHELHNQWKQADFALVNLISQLTALRAGLDKIQEWINNDIVEQHHQLIIDWTSLYRVAGCLSLSFNLMSQSYIRTLAICLILRVG